MWTRLDDCVDVLDSKRVPINATEREQRTEGKPESALIPYYGATGKVGWIDDYLFDEELLLLGEDGAPFLESNKNKAYVIRGKSWVNNHAHVLRAVDGVTSNSDVCHYLNLFDFHEYVTGTTRLKLNQSQMNKIPIPLAPLPEQHRIVTEIEKQFTRLDAGSAAVKRAQANLKRYKAAVLKAACEGKLVEQNPSDEPASALLARMLAERRVKWELDLHAKGKDPKKAKYEEPKSPDINELPELPKGWCWTSAEQLSDETRAITYDVIKLGDPVENGIPILRSSDVRHLHLERDHVKRIDPEIANEFKRTFLRGGEVLVTVRGTLGGVVVVPDDCNGFNISREVAMIAFDNAGCWSSIGVLHRIKTCPELATSANQGHRLCGHK